jgi:hypothetical protein
MSDIKFKSCDQVYSTAFCPVIVISIDNTGYTYPVYVEFTRLDGRKYKKSFTADGRHYERGPISLSLVDRVS